jgi:rhodanese-related sulfurtransferase
MDFDVEDRESVKRGAPPPSKKPQEVDLSVIPKVVSGSGDTPGPNHKEDIGRTWCSAQIIGGVSPFCLDVRPPNEVVAGMLPNALLMSGEHIFENTHLLPTKEERVVVYDQTGDLSSGEIAQKLRDRGWIMARRLRGGFVEWIEYGEEIESPKSHGDYKIGDSYRHESKDYFIHRIVEDTTNQSVVSIELYSLDGVFMMIELSET